MSAKTTLPTRPAGQVVQRSFLGFSHLKQPTGYGSVSLSATLNGVDIGKAWSKKTTYSIGSEHAEDAVVDYVQQLELVAEFPSGGKDLETADLKLAASLKYQKVLIISNLTASPCSSKFGTCTKPDADGCAERLIELAKEGYTITVSADHYYQPDISGSKELSKNACDEMRKNGITVHVAKS